MSEVEKAINALMSVRKTGDGVTMFEVERLRKAVRAEAIASTESKFRELAEKWRKEAEEGGPKDERCPACLWNCLNSLESILTRCPQSRHDAGESKSK